MKSINFYNSLHKNENEYKLYKHYLQDKADYDIEREGRNKTNYDKLINLMINIFKFFCNFYKSMKILGNNRYNKS